MHFALVVVFNLTIGFITAALRHRALCRGQRGGRGIMQVARKVWQPSLVMIAVLALITYVPAVAMWLPKLVMGR